MGMFLGMDPFSLVNLQMSAILAAHQMGPINSPMEQWGHLNPNFVFQGGQVDMGYAPQAYEQEVTMEGVGSAIEPDEFAQPHSPYNSAASLPKRQLNLSAEEIDDIADKIFEDLSDEKKRQSYLHPPANLATTAASQHPPSPAPSRRPTLPARSPSSRLVSTINPTSSPASPLASLNPPSAPRLMRLRDGKDISKSESAYLRSNTDSPQSAKKNTGQGRAEVREYLPGTPSKNAKRQDRAGGNNRHGAEGRIRNRLFARTGSGTSLQDETRYPKTGKQKDIGSGSKDKGQDDGRLESLVVSTLAQDASSATRFPNSRVRPPTSIPAPLRDPFLDFDPHRPDPSTFEYRRNEEIILQEDHEKEVKRLTASDVDKNIFLGQGENLEKWPAKKTQSMEADVDEHHDSRTQLEQKPRRQEKNKNIQGRDKDLAKGHTDSSVDGRDLRRSSRTKLSNANSEPILNPRPYGNAAAIFEAGGTIQHQKSEKALLGTRGSGGSNTTKITNAVRPVVRGVSFSQPKESSHHTMLPSNELRARHEHELELLGEGVTVQEREEVTRRHRGEWDEWSAALPMRQAARQNIRRGENAMPVRDETETGLRAIDYAGSQTSERVEEVSAPTKKKKKRVRPCRFIYLTSSELTARHAQQLSSQLKSASEKEKKELLMKQEDELVKWHDFQVSQRQEQASEGDLQISAGDPAKRKAIEDAKEGRSKKLVRLNSSTAAVPRPQDQRRLLIAPRGQLTEAAVPDGAVLGDHRETAAPMSVVKMEHSPEEDIYMGDLPAKDITTKSLADLDGVLNAVGNSASPPQSGASRGGSFEGKTKDEELEGGSSGVGYGAQSPGSTRKALADIVAAQVSTQASQATRGPKASLTPQRPDVARTNQVEDVTPEIEPPTRSPPIPAGEWILDSFLDSLSTAPPASLEPAPSCQSKALSCVLS